MVIHSDQDIRLKQLMDRYLPSRGKFSAVAVASGISESKWKNFYYEKQSATKEMLDYWCTKYTNEADWLLTGEEPPDKEEFPFLSRIPKKSETHQISDRLIWLIAQLSAPWGDSLFSYLEGISHGRVSATDWSKMVFKLMPPTAEMVQIVCTNCPFLTEWIIHGLVRSPLQIDPTDKTSLLKWKASDQPLSFPDLTDDNQAS